VADATNNPAQTCITIGRLDSASSIRCACRRIAVASIRGLLEPKRGMLAVAAIRTASKALELETAEAALREARAIRIRREQAQMNRLGAVDAERVAR
jgi:hypothetical protein